MAVFIDDAPARDDPATHRHQKTGHNGRPAEARRDRVLARRRLQSLRSEPGRREVAPSGVAMPGMSLRATG
jgi:hypothetical protein